MHIVQTNSRDTTISNADADCIVWSSGAFFTHRMPREAVLINDDESFLIVRIKNLMFPV